MKNREITFIVKMRNQARETMRGLGNTFGEWARKAREAANEKRKLAAEMNKTSVAANMLRGALAAAAVYLGGGQIMKAASDWGAYANKLRQVTESEEQMVAMREKLFEVSQRSLAPMEGSVNLYSRASVALAKLGAKGDDVLRFTETFSKALTLGGASGAEAASATLQFSQALASGTLRGEEFNAVNEASQRVMKVLADYLGKDTGELRKLAMEGKITAKTMYEAFTQASSQIDGEFGKMTLTFDTMFTLAGNSFTRFIGRIDEATGFQKGFSDAFKFFISTILPEFEAKVLAVINFLRPAFVALGNTIGDIWNTLTAVIGPVIKAVVDFVVNLGKAIGVIDPEDVLGSLADGLAKIVEFAAVAMTSFITLTTIVGGLSLAFGVAAKAVEVFNAALSANPIGLVLVLISTAVGMLYSMRDAMIGIGDTSVSVSNILFGTFEWLGIVFDRAATGLHFSFGIAWDKIKIMTSIAVTAMVGKIKAIGEAIAELVDSLGKAISLDFEGAGQAKDRMLDKLGLTAVSTDAKIELDKLYAELVEADRKYRAFYEWDSGIPDYVEFLAEKQRASDELKRLAAEAAAKQNAPVLIPEIVIPKIPQVAGLSADALKDANAAHEKRLREMEAAEQRWARNKENYVNAVSNAMVSLQEKFLPAISRQRELNELTDKMQEIMQAAALGTGDYEEALRRAGMTAEQVGYLQARIALETKENKTAYDEVRLAALRYVEDTEDGLSLMGRMADSVIGSMSSAFEEFVTTGKLNFKSLVSSILADLARMAAQNVFKQMLGMFSGGASGDGGLFSMIGSAIFGAPTGHTGGIVGQSLTGSTRVHPAVWANAKRYHSGGLVGPGSGLKQGERAIIAKDTEAVMPTVRLPDGSYGVKATGSMGGGGQIINFQPTIQVTVEKAEDDAQAKRQGEIISKDIEQGLRSMIREEIYQAAQPGGVGNWRP